MRLARAVLCTARDMLIIVLSVAWSGCAHPPAQPATPPAPTATICTADNQVQPFLCGIDKHTKDGYACAICDGDNRACVTTDFIWCVRSFCDDAECSNPAKKAKR